MHTGSLPDFFLSARAFMPRTKPVMHPNRVQQMLSKRMCVKENNWNVLEETQRLLMLPGIFKGTHSEWKENSKSTKAFSETLEPRARECPSLCMVKLQPWAAGASSSSSSSSVPFLREKSMAGSKRMNWHVYWATSPATNHVPHQSYGCLWSTENPLQSAIYMGEFKILNHSDLWWQLRTYYQSLFHH